MLAEEPIEPQDHLLGLKREGTTQLRLEAFDGRCVAHAHPADGQGLHAARWLAVRAAARCERVQRSMRDTLKGGRGPTSAAATAALSPALCARVRRELYPADAQLWDARCASRVGR